MFTSKYVYNKKYLPVTVEPCEITRATLGTIKVATNKHGFDLKPNIF